MATWVRARGVRLGIAIGVTAAVAACSVPGTAGRSGIPLTPASVLRAAVSKLHSEQGSTARIRAAISLGSIGEMNMTGVEQFTPSVALHVQIDVAGGQLSGALGGSLEVILEDGIEYLKYGNGAMSRLLGGKQWLEVDLNQLNAANTGGSLGPALAINQNADPAQQVRLLLTSANLKKVGLETVDGVSTTHYAGDVDPAKMLQQQTASKLSPDEIQKLQSSLQTAGISSEHIDLWLDSAGLPAETKVSADSSMGALTFDEHLSDWGVPVSITPPPADQVTDILKLGSGG